MGIYQILRVNLTAAHCSDTLELGPRPCSHVGGSTKAFGSLESWNTSIQKKTWNARGGKRKDLFTNCCKFL